MEQEMAIRLERDRLVEAMKVLRRTLRTSHGMTLRAFAQCAGVSATQMSAWTCEPIDRPPDFICRARIDDEYRDGK
jgi:DNA-binding transcriptional regulator YiaG